MTNDQAERIIHLLTKLVDVQVRVLEKIEDKMNEADERENLPPVPTVGVE